MKRILIPSISLSIICTALQTGLNSEAPIPPARAHHALVYDEANKTVWMTTGSTPLDGGNSIKFFNDSWSFNGKAWKQNANASDERSGVALAYDSKRNKIFSYGGFTPDNNSHGELRVLENNEWK